jgi:hypothetical protein
VVGSDVTLLGAQIPVALALQALPTLKTSQESYERDIDTMQFALDRHIFGSVDDVRRRVDEFIANGVQHFELKMIYPSMDNFNRQMDLWAENILPYFQ